jgi:hypothetical protein
VKACDSFLGGLKSVVFLDHLIEEDKPSPHMVQGGNLATTIDPEPKALVGCIDWSHATVLPGLWVSQENGGIALRKHFIYGELRYIRNVPD